MEAATAFVRVADRHAATRAWQAAAHYRDGLAHNAGDPARANNLASLPGALTGMDALSCDAMPSP